MDLVDNRCDGCVNCRFSVRTLTEQFSGEEKFEAFYTFLVSHNLVLDHKTCERCGKLCKRFTDPRLKPAIFVSKATGRLHWPFLWKDMTLLTMDQWIRLHSQTVGKDKLARLIQYLSRFLWYYIEKRKQLRDTVQRLKILENALSTFRKLLRFGKSIEVLYGALKTLHLTDPVLRMVTTLSRIQQSLFLFYDNLLWLSRAGLLNFDKTKLSEYSSRFWLASVILNLLRDMYEIHCALRSKAAASIRNLPCSLQTYPVLRTISSGFPPSRHFLAFIEAHQDIFWDTLKNACDLCIPLTTLGQAKFSPGFIGLVGTVSSVAGIIPVINPLLKLAPS